jgi:hypothetical protein
MASQAFTEITQPVLPGIEIKELPKEAFDESVNKKSKKKTVKPALPKSK